MAEITSIGPVLGSSTTFSVPFVSTGATTGAGFVSGLGVGLVVGAGVGTGLVGSSLHTCSIVLFSSVPRFAKLLDR